MLSSQDIDPRHPHRRFFLIRWILGIWHWLVPPTLAHQDRQSSTARLVARWSLVVLCVGVMISVVFYARPIHGQYKEWKATSLLKQAKAAQADGDLVGAVLTAQKAVGLAPDFEPAVRANAELLTLISQDQAVYFWDKLASLGNTTLEDQMGKVRALQRIHRDREAVHLLEDLLRQHPADARLMKLGEEVSGKLQRDSVLMHVLSDYVAAHPEDRESHLRLLRLQLQTQALEKNDVANALWPLTEGDDDISLQALRLLGELDTLDAASRDRLADRFDSHPLSGEAEHVMALGIRVALHPARKNAFLDEAVARVHDLKPAQLVPLVRWMALHGEPGRVLTLITENDIKKDEGLLVNYLNALMALGRNKDLARLVNDRTVTLRVAARTFYLAHLALVNNEPRDEVRRKLLLVKDEMTAAGQSDYLLLLGKYCQERQFYDVAEAALEAATQSTRSPVERSGFVAWIQCCKISGHTDGLARATREAVRRWPDDQSFLEDSIYARLLQGDEIETSLNMAERLLAANPTDSTRKLLTGFGYWRLGDTESSVTACQQIDLRAVSPGQQAVFAAIVHDAGPLPVAQGDTQLFRKSLEAILTPIPRNAPMLPEEADMLRRAQE